MLPATHQASALKMSSCRNPCTMYVTSGFYRMSCANQRLVSHIAWIQSPPCYHVRKVDPGHPQRIDQLLATSKLYWLARVRPCSIKSSIKPGRPRFIDEGPLHHFRLKFMWIQHDLFTKGYVGMGWTPCWTMILGHGGIPSRCIPPTRYRDIMTRTRTTDISILIQCAG